MNSLAITHYSKYIISGSVDCSVKILSIQEKCEKGLLYGMLIV